MPSSTSSFESASPDPVIERSTSAEARIALRPGLRLTAADRPGIAQPVPERDIPDRRWGAIMLAALIMTLLMLGAWEWHWRAFGVEPSIANSDALWATQRRRIDHGEGDGATVLIGSSRMLFDLQLPVWQKLSGKRPIQLALEGTSPMFALEDLADDPDFRNGRLLVGVAPDIFFSGFAYRGGVLKYTRKQSPSQRVGQWLSMHLAEPFLAFDDPDYALPTVLERQEWWPARPGMHPHKDVRKLMVVTAPDRASHIWDKLEKDPAYAALAQSIWAQHFEPGPGMPSPAELQKTMGEQIERATVAVAKLRKRNVEVIFVRTPSAGGYLAFEDKVFPRAKTWNLLLAKTGAPGVHFQDHPELQGFWLPEWSHLAARDAVRFTAALYRIIEHDVEHRAASRIAKTSGR
ncbi:MAG TPA: hypothetical protein VN662_07850 [Rhodanobacteraceae bacterium]|nr:hypothetical protein [Rhodanobacteraceae bacterium]